MAYDLEEQEQIATLKAWWKQYGNLLLYAVIAVLVTVAAYQGWRSYSAGQTMAGLTLYEQLEAAQRRDEHKKAVEIASEITRRYGSTPYATLGALAGARSAVAMADPAAAESQLRWVVDNAREQESRDLARLRLAGVLLDQKRHDDALALLDVAPEPSLAGLYAEMKGDVMVAQGRTAEARAHYQAALDKSEAASTYRATLQLKMDGLGAVKSAPAAQ